MSIRVILIIELVFDPAALFPIAGSSPGIGGNINRWRTVVEISLRPELVFRMPAMANVHSPVFIESLLVPHIAA